MTFRDKCTEKFENATGQVFLKIGLYNPLPCTFSSQFLIFLELAFIENYLTPHPHTNTTNSRDLSLCRFKSRNIEDFHLRVRDAGIIRWQNS